MTNDLTIENGIVIDCHTNAIDVIIPDGVTSIGDRAFRHCESLEAITIPNSVTFIGNYAFAYCKSIESITIPNGVTSIGVSAFAGCFNLKTVTIPDGVTFIGDGAFYSCANVIMQCNRNSYAEEYAKKNNVYYKITD